ncbi:MAG: isocitrate lyase/phosphoenolpyruvate mutase family protein [Acidobacteriota bacterium]|nr:isocitrate lyase/phosphoenolpyruvate mutase family protein [Acidobacteriota bacterium]
MATAQASKAEAFRKLHAGPGILVLPNAWDAMSARVFESQGFPAIGTSSGGVAFALGYPDGERVPFAEMLQAIARIVRTVSVPVTADIEAGYGPSIEAAVESVKAVISVGAAGINLEDSSGPGELFDISSQAAKIKAIQASGAAAGVPLVINARTDVFLARIGDPATRFERAVERLNAFRDAGADCLFAPGVRDAETISKLVRAVRGPLNILAGEGTPSAPELQKMGVRRVSVGSGPARAAMTLVRRIGAELLSSGTYGFTSGGVITHPEANKLFER